LFSPFYRGGIALKKILLVTSEYPPYGSGIANVVHALEKRLIQKGQHCKVLSRKGADFNISTPLDRFPGIIGLIPFWQQAAKYISKNTKKYDIIWLHSPMFYRMDDLKNVNVLFSNHTTYSGFYQSYKKTGYTSLLPYYYLLSSLERAMFRKLSNHNSAIVTAVSPSVATEVCNNGLGFLPEVIPNGIDLDSQFQTSLTKQFAREKLAAKGFSKIKTTDFIFLYVGRITEQKRPFKLLSYFRFLKKVIPNAVLIICGKGNLLSKLKKEASGEEGIYLIGYTSAENLGLLFRASDAFISLSCYEGLPLTALEAARHGLPLVLSDISPHRWLIRSRIGRGIIIDDNKNDITQIRDLTSSETKPFYDRAYDWDVIVDRYLTVMENITGQ
jgi:glycosyltransferase involved in cell wall biosynthesis